MNPNEVRDELIGVYDQLKVRRDEIVIELRSLVGSDYDRMWNVQHEIGEALNKIAKAMYLCTASTHPRRS